jgi:hypothetical protein
MRDTMQGSTPKYSATSAAERASIARGLAIAVVVHRPDLEHPEVGQVDGVL